MSDSLVSQYTAALAAVSAMSTDAVAYGSLDDTALLELSRVSARVQQAAGIGAALIAGEVARRSTRELGHSGLAQASGFRTPEELLRSTTGATVRDAAQTIRVGRLAHEAAGTIEKLRPWLAPVGASVTGEGLSVAAAESISAGLGTPTEVVTADKLAAAAQQLCDEAGALDADRLHQRARQLRDELDEAGIAGRENARREARSLRFLRRSDGMSRLTWDMDPETAAHIGDIYDRATSPRRGGPRFVDADASAHAERILDDQRSTEQIASDVFSELLRQGAAADSTQLLGTGAPSIRVLVTETALRERRGHGRIEGQVDPISIESVERLACTGSTLPIRLDDEGQPLDVGREQRLYTRRQRIALAARDGGCRWPGCERPPSWTEAHHINHWARDHGRTDIADGILLCRHHHLLAHNNHWEIQRQGSSYWLIPHLNTTRGRNHGRCRRRAMQCTT